VVSIWYWYHSQDRTNSRSRR